MKPIRTPLATDVELGPHGALHTWAIETRAGRAVCTVFEPTPEEREAIANGANLMLAIWQPGVPPVAIEVRSGVDYEPVVARQDGVIPTDVGVDELDPRALAKLSTIEGRA